MGQMLQHVRYTDMLQHLTGRVCPPLSPPASGRHSRDRRAGEMCELNATWRLTARQCGRLRPYAHDWP